MENASKALIIAAEVLIGVMIISIGVVIFQYFAGFSEQRYKEMEDIQISEFNNQFLKLYGQNGNGETIECTIHDIVSLAGLAQRNNLEYELIEETGNENNPYRVINNSDNSLYVRIDVTGINGSGTNLELKSNKDLIDLIKNNSLSSNNETKKYQCSTSMDNIINQTTKRVKYMRFSPI